jgi:Ca2+-binding RTX toxin-like protein
MAVIKGTAGNDDLRGTKEADTIRAKAGEDFAAGRGGDDFIKGGRDNDELHGAKGNDDIFGGAGDDELYGGRGNDRLTGGAGEDQFFFKPNSSGVDRIIDFDGQGQGDTLNFEYFGETGKSDFELVTNENAVTEVYYQNELVALVTGNINMGDIIV